MASKTVQPIDIKLGIKGGEQLGKLSSAFRDLGKTVGQTDAGLEEARRSIIEYGRTANQSEALIQGQIKAFEGLRKQAEIGGRVFTQLESDIDALRGVLRGASTATEAQRQALVNIGSTANATTTQIQGAINSLIRLRGETRPNSEAFNSLGESIERLTSRLNEVTRETEELSLAQQTLNQSVSASAGGAQRQIQSIDAVTRSLRQQRDELGALGNDSELVQRRLREGLASLIERGVQPSGRRSFEDVYAESLLSFGEVPIESMVPVKDLRLMEEEVKRILRDLQEQIETSLAQGIKRSFQETARAGRESARAMAAAFADPEMLGILERLDQRIGELPNTTAGFNQRLRELQQQLANTDRSSENYRRVSEEISKVQKELAKDVYGYSEALEQLAVSQENAARRAEKLRGIGEYVASVSGLGATAAAGRAGTPMVGAIGGYRDPATGAMIATGRGMRRDRMAYQESQELERVASAQGDLEQAFDRAIETYRSSLQTMQDYEQKRHDDFMAQVAAEDAAQEQAFKKQEAREEKLYQAMVRREDRVLQRGVAAKGMLGLTGDLSPFYEGIVGIAQSRQRGVQSRMGKTPQQSLADIVNIFNSDLRRTGSGFLDSEQKIREAAIDFSGGSRKVRERFEEIPIGKTPTAMYPQAEESPAQYRQRIEGAQRSLIDRIRSFGKKLDESGDGFLKAEKDLRKAAIDFAGGSEEVKSAFKRFSLGKTPMQLFPAGGETPEAYVERIRGGFTQLDIPEFSSFRKGTTRELQLVRDSLSELRLDLDPLAAGFETMEKRAVSSIQRIDRELERRQSRSARRRMSPMQMTQAAGAAISGGIFGGPEGFLGGAIGAIGGVGSAFAGAAIGAQVGGFRKLISEFADYSAKIEKLKISLKGIVGSQEEYSRALAAAAGATEKLNIPQEVAIQGITRLTAAVKGAGGGVADAELAFNSINSAIIATGGGAEQVEGAITALVQIFSKGKVSAEEINQIAERLPGTFNKIAEASGRTGTELANALQAGTVGLNDLQKFLINLGDEYGDLAKQIASSSQSAGERLARSFDNLRENVGKALQPVGADFQDAFNEFLKEITPELIESSKAVASLLKVILESKDVILPVVELTAKILALKLAISGLSALKAGVAGFFAASASGAKITGDAMVGLQAKVSGLTVVVKRLAVAFAGLAAFDYLFKAFASGQELETLRKRAESGAAGTELTYKSRAEIIEAQNEAQKQFIELLKEEERIKEKMGNANIFSVWFGSLGRSASELEKVKLKQESLLDVFGVQVPGGDELADYKSPEQIKNEKEQAAQSLLNAIEQRENAIAQARIQLEEQAANIRKQAIEQAKQLEERFANQRLQKERQLQDLRRQLAYVEEDIAFGAEEARAVAAGADPEIFAARRQIIEFSRQQKEEEIALDRQLLDEQTENTKALEEFKINNAKAINEANEAYAKQIGRIQQEYARSVAKIIEEGTGRAGERLELAGVMIANEIKKAEAQRTALQLGYSFKRGGGVSGYPDYGSVLNEFGQNSLAAARQAFIDAEQAIDRAYNSLAEIPTATAIAAPAITSIGNVTADLDRKAIALAKNLDAARAQIRGISEDLDDEKFLEKVSSAFRGTGAGIYAQQKSLASEQSQQRRVLRLREEGFSDEVAGQLVKQEDLVASQLRILEAQFEEAKKKRPQLEKRLTEDFEKTKENIDASSNSIREFIAALDNIPTEIKLRTAVVDAKQQLRDLVDTSNQVKGAATAIGDAFSQSFVDAISGSKTAKEALADFFSSVGSYFLDMAKQIIAKMIQIAILNSVAKLLPSTSLTTSSGVSMSAGTATQSGFNMGASLAGMFKANGGPVNANQPYIVGERGPELFVPFQQGSITSNEAMQQASMAQLPFTRNAESISQATQTAQAMQAAGPINVKYESTVINGVEYVTREQAERIGAQSAERGRALTLQALQNSVKTRSRVGI